MFTRLTATVTISAPDASCAFAITALEVYFPVPMMRRDWNVLPAMTSVSMFIGTLSSPPRRNGGQEVSFPNWFSSCPPFLCGGEFQPLSSPHKIYNLDVIAFADQRV